MMKNYTQVQYISLKVYMLKDNLFWYGQVKVCDIL